MTGGPLSNVGRARNSAEDARAAEAIARVKARDLQTEPDISDAFARIDRALLNNDNAELAAWAREFGRPACEAIRNYRDGRGGDEDEW